jgi:predicted patatin/cPLA2 family phospholipase
MNNQKPLVFYFTAGAMSGIFSAGFSKTMEELGIKNKIHAMYGNSAGSLSALYFLSNQVELGSALYYEDLNDNKYIKWNRLGKYVLTGFKNYFFGTKTEAEPVFDIDLIEQIIKSKRKINFQEYKNSGVDLYMIAYNLTTGHHDYLKLEKEEEVIPFLRATGGGHPAYPHSSHIHGNLYIDGGTIDDERRIARIIERHPDKEIVVVINNPKPNDSNLRTFINRASIALVMLPFFGWREAWRTANSNFGNTNLKKMTEEYPFLHFIASDLFGYAMSTNAADHKMLYKRGQELAQEFFKSNKLTSFKV